jgi:hypothetical protein
MNIVLKIAIVFVATLLVDFSWSMYIRSLAQNKTFNAACWSAFITLAGGITVIAYNEDHRLLIPAIVGGFIGTYLSKYFNTNKNGNKASE